MPVKLKSGFSLESYDNLKGIASQAFGHRIGEKTKGGMGYMGVMRKADGSLSVFKCLTHSSEYGKFEKGEDTEYESELKEASDNLKTLLRRLGDEAGVDKDEMEDILSAYTGKADYLSRKMVAKAVTLIAKHAVEGGDSDQFWAEVTFAGTVHNTKLRAKKEGDTASIAFVSNEDQHNILALREVRAMSAAGSDELPTTIDELEVRLADKNGDFGEKMLGLLKKATAQVENNCPGACECFAYTTDWMFDRHKNDFYGHETLAKPREDCFGVCTWVNVRLKMFKRSLELSLDKIKAELQAGGRSSIDEKDILRLFRRAYVRSGYAYAGLKTACKVAELRNLKCRFEGLLLKKTYDAETKQYVADEELQDRIIEIALQASDKQLDSPAFINDLEDRAAIVANRYLAGEIFEYKIKDLDKDNEELDKDDAAEQADQQDEGYFQVEADGREKETMKNWVINSVSFIYSDIKVMDGEDIGIEDDTGKTARLDEARFKFESKADWKSDTGDEIARRMFD